MKRTLEESVVELLSFSRSGDAPAAELTGFSADSWERCLTWMDDSGLALYFLRAIKNQADWIPGHVLERLQSRHRSNLERTAYMERQFALINRAFETAGIRCAAVKGLTLVPEFCPEASLRHQSDFDYLVDGPSLPSARRVLEDIGYELHKEEPHELILLLPCSGKPKRGDEQYKVHSPHSVELHLSIIGEFRHLAWGEPPFLQNAIKYAFQGSAFYGLRDDDAFVLQSIHAFHHILDGWIKLSWLYEIGYFVEKHATDSDLWSRISGRLAADPLLREAVAVVVSLASRFFRARIPIAVNRWIEQLRPTVRMWIENYARLWAFGQNLVDEYAWLPTSKLVLFLHQQYVPDGRKWRNVLSSRLLALRGIDRAMSGMNGQSSAKRRRNHRVSVRELRKFAYHLGANLRYLSELPRWWILTRARCL